MTTATFTKTREQILIDNPFRMKTHEEVLADLALSRYQYAKGEYQEAGEAIKEIRARYGIL